MTTQNTTTLKEFDSRVHIYSSTLKSIGYLLIKYANVITPGNLTHAMYATVKNYGEARISLYNYLIVDRN